MPWTPKPYYHDRDKCWLSYSAGEHLPSGRRKGVRNYQIGPPADRDGPANSAAAQLWLAGLIAAKADGERRATDPLLSDLILAFLAHAERLAASGARATRTVEGRADRLDRFAGFRHGGRKYGSIPVSRLKPADPSRFIRDGQARGLSPGYINSIALSVHALLNWAARPVPDRGQGWPEKVIAENPFKGVERPKVPAPAPALRRARDPARLPRLLPEAGAAPPGRDLGPAV